MQSTETVSRAYVGNLPWSATDDELAKLFEPFGQVTHAKVVIDRETARSRGFGFVQMDTREAMVKAMESLNGTDFQGRGLVVKEALPKPERESGGGGRDYRPADRSNARVANFQKRYGSDRGEVRRDARDDHRNARDWDSQKW